MTLSNVTNAPADSCDTITARRLEFFVLARRGRVLHRRAIVSARFDGVGLRPVRINAPDFCRLA